MRYRPTSTYKVKTIHIQAWIGPEYSRSLRLPDFKTIGKSGKVVSPKRRLSLPPRKYSWYSLLLESESTSGL